MVAALLLALTATARADQAVDRPGDLRARIERRVRDAQAEVGVAFRTLDGREEVLLVADTPFHAASTMKVPVLIELYRQIDAGRLTLDDPLPVVNRFASIVDGSPYALDPADDSDKGAVYKSLGATLPVRELAEAMITVSSNLATNLLIDKLGVASIQRTVTALGADGMRVVRGVEDNKAYEQGLINTTTARGLLTLFEAIGRGKAASDASCGEMIAILRRQQFNDGIPAGLPPGVPVAHKTGTITRIHHDAGIVYAKRPYVLVVLVRGIDDQKRSAALIADISRLVFEAYGK
jgi:beta-lactamase class A